MSVHVCHVKLYLHHFFITGTSTFKEKPVCRSHYQSESDSNSGGEEFDHELTIDSEGETGERGIPTGCSFKLMLVAMTWLHMS